MFISLMLVGLVGIQPANAASERNTNDEPQSCVNVDTTAGNGNCADVVQSESYSKSGATSKVVSVNGVKLRSKVTVLANIKAKGTPQREQTNCFRTNRSMKSWTSYNAEGSTGWHWKTYPKGYRFCRIGGKVRDPLCHNMVKIGVPKSKAPRNAIEGKVKIVKVIVYKAKAIAKADEKVTSRAKAWCNTNSSTAYGDAKSSASARAIGRASLKGRNKTKLIAKVEAAAQGNLTAQLDGQSITDVKARVRASAFVKTTSEASARAGCTSNNNNPQPPPSEQTCESTYGPGYSGTYPNCVKDGTSTPPPPPNAPGPNPSPSPQDPSPTPSQCYDPATGQPVSPGTPGAYC